MKCPKCQHFLPTTPQRGSVRSAPRRWREHVPSAAISFQQQQVLPRLRAVGSPITPSKGSCGKRRRSISGRPVRRRPRGRRSRMPGSGSNRRLSSSRGCRRPRLRWSRASKSVSSYGIYFFQLGEVRRGLEHLREAEVLAERLNDDHRRGRVCADLIHLHTTLGELDEALGAGTRALEFAARLGDLKLRIKATSYLAQVHCHRAEYPRAIELATANLAKLPADWVHEFFGLPTPPRSTIGLGWSRVSPSSADLPRRPSAEPRCSSSPSSMQQPFTVGFAHQAMAWSHLLRGDWARARSLIEQAIAVFRTRNIGLLLPGMIATSACVLAQLGEAREALTRLQEGDELLERQAARGRIMHLSGSYLCPSSRRFSARPPR